ncbi:MAG: hypothetical protein WKG07_38155 [Hymenobacter sp.]
MPLPRDVVYERLVLRGPAEAQPACLEISGDHRPFVPAPPAARARHWPPSPGLTLFLNFNKPDGSSLSPEKAAPEHGLRRRAAGIY